MVLSRIFRQQRLVLYYVKKSLGHGLEQREIQQLHINADNAEGQRSAVQKKCQRVVDEDHKQRPHEYQ